MRLFWGSPRLASLPPAPARGGAAGRGRGEVPLPVARPRRRRWEGLQCRELGPPGQQAQRRPRGLHHAPGNGSVGAFVATATKQDLAADLRRPRPVNEREFQAPCVPRDWPSLNRGRSQHPKTSVTQRKPGETVGGWSLLTHGHRTHSSRGTPHFPGKGTGGRKALVPGPCARGWQSQIHRPRAFCL